MATSGGPTAGDSALAPFVPVNLSDTLRRQLAGWADNKYYVENLHEENVSLEQFEAIEGYLDNAKAKLVMPPFLKWSD
jgi:hypothetical protein